MLETEEWAMEMIFGNSGVTSLVSWPITAANTT